MNERECCVVPGLHTIGEPIIDEDDVRILKVRDEDGQFALYFEDEYDTPVIFYFEDEESIDDFAQADFFDPVDFFKKAIDADGFVECYKDESLDYVKPGDFVSYLDPDGQHHETNHAVLSTFDDDESTIFTDMETKRSYDYEAMPLVRELVHGDIHGQNNGPKRNDDKKRRNF